MTCSGKNTLIVLIIDFFFLIYENVFVSSDLLMGLYEDVYSRIIMSKNGTFTELHYLCFKKNHFVISLHWERKADISSLASWANCSVSQHAVSCLKTDI